MQSATLEDIALRSTNPVKRAMDVLCVILLQLLTMIVLADDPDPAKRRNQAVFGPHTILARFDAGETFDLPPLVIASFRSILNCIRIDLRNGRFCGAPSGSQIQADAQNRATPAKLTRLHTAARHNATNLISRAQRGAASSPNHGTGPSHGHPRPREKPAYSLPCLLTSISLRYRNDVR